MKNYSKHYQAKIKGLQEENARLKAEVEAVTQEYRDATNHYNKLHNDLQAEVERLRKAGDKMAKTLEKDQQRYNGCPSAEAEMWWIARDGGCP